jgi:hypothetical protein
VSDRGGQAGRGFQYGGAWVLIGLGAGLVLMGFIGALASRAR